MNCSYTHSQTAIPHHQYCNAVQTFSRPDVTHEQVLKAGCKPFPVLYRAHLKEKNLEILSKFENSVSNGRGNKITLIQSIHTDPDVAGKKTSNYKLGLTER